MIVRSGLLLLLVTLAACEPEEEAPVCHHDPALEWENFGQRFMAQYCTGCHSSLTPEEYRNGAPLEANFDTYQGVIDRHGTIRAFTSADAPMMPPGGGPTEAEYRALHEWLDCAVAPDALALEEGG